MKKILIFCSVIFLLTFYAYTVSYPNDAANISSIKKMNVEELIKLLNHSDWSERDKAIVYGVEKYTDNERVRIALIKLLEKENSVREDWWKEYEAKQGKVEFLRQRYGEGYGEYYGNLIFIVIKLNDKRAISSLVNAVGSGNAVINALAEFGELAVDLLIQKFDEKTFFANNLKPFIITTLGRIVVKNTVSTTEKDKIKAIFIKSLENDHYLVRKNAIKELGNFEDSEVIPLIEKLAREDPYFLEMKTGKKYPVREEAKRVLEKLKKKK